MKLTVKQLKTLILEAIKEQAAAPGAGSNPNELNQALQNVMDYMASLTAQRNSLLAALNAIPASGPPSPATTNAIEVAKRNVLNRGNTAINSLRSFASIAPEAIRSIEFVQNELRTKDFARLTPEQRQFVDGLIFAVEDSINEAIEQHNEDLSYFEADQDDD